MTRFEVKHAGTTYEFDTLDQAKEWVDSWPEGTVVTVTDRTPGPGQGREYGFESGKGGYVHRKTLPTSPLDQ